MQTPLYFAYGSNTLQIRLEARVGRVKKVSNYTIPGFTIDFNRLGFAYMRPEPKAEVDGVLYELTDSQIAKLDNYEWYPINYGKSYDITGGRIFYFYNHPVETAKVPNLPYLNYVIDGLVQNRLHVAANRLIDYKNRHYKLTKGSRHKMMDIL